VGSHTCRGVPLLAARKERHRCCRRMFAQQFQTSASEPPRDSERIRGYFGLFSSFRRIAAQALEKWRVRKEVGPKDQSIQFERGKRARQRDVRRERCFRRPAWFNICPLCGSHWIVQESTGMGHINIGVMRLSPSGDGPHWDGESDGARLGIGTVTV
jgi:hypothetical protein